MDIATLIGLVVGSIMILASILAGGLGGAMGFIDIGSIFVTIGGGICATFVAYPTEHLKRTWAVFSHAMFHESKSAEQLIRELIQYAEIARRDGILSLENVTKEIDDPFVVNGIQMAVDGQDPEVIEQIMTTELDSMVERHELGRNIFKTAGNYLPAFGMIGTLIGLVKMLQSVAGGDGGGGGMEAIGQGMALALLTTLYGSVGANLFTLPIADKLEKRSNEEVKLKTIVIKGVMAIQSGDNPRIVEQKLLTFLPPGTQLGETEGA